MHTLKVENWGLIEYEKALVKQLEYVELVAQNPTQGFLIFCSHPPVVTLGRKTEPGDVFAWTGKTIEISRGGRATYHGPSQLVVYPILKVNDIHRYLRLLESSVVEVLADYQIKAQGKIEDTGVWVNSQKIASLGIGVKKWVAYHGAAINLENDAQAFQGMKPCGFNRDVMTNLEALIGKKIDREIFQEKLAQKLLQSLSDYTYQQFPLTSHSTLDL